MDIQRIIGYWNPWGSGKAEGQVSPTSLVSERVCRLGRDILGFFESTKRESARLTEKKHTFSPFRFLFLTSLIASIRGQLTTPFPAQFDLTTLNGINGVVFNGQSPNGAFGNSLAMGDVNGDEIDDLVAGEFAASIENLTQAGRTYALFGSRNFTSFPLSSVNVTNGVVFDGVNSDDYSGSCLSIGDLNGDGIKDFAIRSNQYEIRSNQYESEGQVGLGTVSVPFGSRTLTSISLSKINGTNGIVFDGLLNMVFLGGVLSAEGDFNGDGIQDLAMSTGSNFETLGNFYIVFGSRTLTSFSLNALNGTNGFVFENFNFTNTGIPTIPTISFGDFNGDHLDDLVIGIPSASPPGRNGAGITWVLLGTRNPIPGGKIQSSDINGTNGFVIWGANPGDASCALFARGDFNKDGIDEIGIGAQMASPSNKTSAGRVYVLLGTTSSIPGGIVDLGTVHFNGSNGFIIDGLTAGASLGRAGTLNGDITGDGIDDLVICTAYASSTNISEANLLAAFQHYVVFGTPTPFIGGTFSLSTLNGSNGFVAYSESEEVGATYIPVTAEGDLNDDGVNDLAIGVPYATSDSNITQAGKICVIFGRKLASPLLPSTSSIHMILSLPKITSSFSAALSLTSKSTSKSLSPTSIISSSFDSASFLPVIPSSSTQNNNIPLFAGLASAVALFAICLFGGIIAYCYKKRSSRNKEQVPHSVPGDEVVKLPPPGMSGIHPIMIPAGESQNYASAQFQIHNGYAQGPAQNQNNGYEGVNFPLSQSQGHVQNPNRAYDAVNSPLGNNIAQNHQYDGVHSPFGSNGASVQNRDSTYGEARPRSPVGYDRVAVQNVNGQYDGVNSPL